MQARPRIRLDCPMDMLALYSQLWAIGNRVTPFYNHIKFLLLTRGDEDSDVDSGGEVTTFLFLSNGTVLLMCKENSKFSKSICTTHHITNLSSTSKVYIKIRPTEPSSL
jgi:hypothetical protein